MSAPMFYALTSLSPAPHRLDAQQAAVRTWRAAGLQVRSFNHPSEIAALAPVYDVEFIPVDRTTIEIFGRHCIPINAVLDWAAGCDAPVIVINSDIELRLDPWELQRIRWAASGGVAVFVRHNYEDDVQRSV